MRRYANTLGTAKHETIKEQMRARYTNILGTPKHDKVKARRRKLYANTMAVCSNDFFANIKKFMLEIDKGPYFIGVVCNRCINRKSVLMFVENKYINFDNFRYNKVEIKGAMCNIPNETDNICNILPRGIHGSGLILLKLKRKLCYRGHVFFELVRPDVVKETLN